MQKDIERAKEILRILRSGEECNREKLKEELHELEEKYKCIFF